MTNRCPPTNGRVSSPRGQARLDAAANILDEGPPPDGVREWHDRHGDGLATGLRRFIDEPSDKRIEALILKVNEAAEDVLPEPARTRLGSQRGEVEACEKYDQIVGIDVFEG